MNISFDVKHNLKHDNFVKKGSDGSKEFLVSHFDACELLVKHSDLKYLRTYPRIEKTYLYQESVGCYQEITDGELKVCVRSILSNLKLNRLINRSYVDNLIYCLKFDPVIAQEGDPTPDRNFLVVENGLLNITTREVRQWSPEVFALNRVPYVYSGMKAIPKFEAFLDDFTGGDQDKKKFIRAVLNALLHSRVDLQIFIYIYGKGGTGKSTLALIAVALVGLESTHSTSLKAINIDQYEIVNLIGKKLILMSDTESYSANVSQLKALTGQDAVRGRVMYQNKTIEVRLSGLILIVGNKLLNTRDTSDAITRRMRPFKADHKAKKVLTMLESVVINGEQRWRGELAEELPGILHWVLTCDPQDITNHLVNAAIIPALVEGISEAKQTLDPVSSWIDDEIIPCTQEDGSYVGFIPTNAATKRQSMDRMVLFPAYSRWCKRRGLRPISHRYFSDTVINNCMSIGLNVGKVRKAEGIFIFGIKLKQGINNPDYI